MSEIVEKSVIGAILIDPKCVSEIYEQIVMEISNRYGTVRFHNGLLLSIEVEYIRLLE